MAFVSVLVFLCLAITSRVDGRSHGTLSRLRHKNKIFTLHFIGSSGDLCVPEEKLPRDVLETGENILAMAGFSYCRIDKIMAWKCPVCSQDFTVQGTYQTSRTAAFIADNGKDIFVVFRGSSTPSAYLSDFNAIPTPYPPNPDVTFLGRLFSSCDHCVHRGFLSVYEEIMNEGLREMFDATLKRLPDAKIFLSGHSAGGAVATIMAYDLALPWTPEQRLQINVYSFGSPRVFTKGMTNEYNTFVKNTYRFVYKEDPVPHVPLLSMGYEHVGQLIFGSTPVFEDCICKGLVDSDGGDLRNHHSGADHDYEWRINLDNYERDSVTLGCDGRVASTLEEAEEGDLNTNVVQKLE